MIAHIDADSFFASVLVRTHPHLRGKPLLAVGMGGGCVIAASYEAKAYGVKTGMPLREARLLVPDGIEMPADFRETAIASRQIESILRDLGPRIEQMSIDEWFLDLSSLVGGTPKNLGVWAQTTQATLLSGTDISVSIGIASSKVLAKMAGEYRKPAGVTVVEQRNIQDFLKKRPAGAIPGIGRQRKVKTDAAKIMTAWDLTQADDALLLRLCGRQGIEMKRELLGTCLFPVQEETRPPQSISRCRTFPHTLDGDLLKAHLLKHLEYCTMKMRKEHLVCGGATIHLRNVRYEYQSMHRTFDQPYHTVSETLPTVVSMLETRKRGERINQVGLVLHHLSAAELMQPSIFEDVASSLSQERLQRAFDRIQTRFGRNSITRAAALCVQSGTKQELDFSLIE